MAWKILSIEDDPEITDLLGIVLRSPEVRMLVARTGQSGLDLIQEEAPDLILLDLMLPGELSGWEVYDAIRAARAGRRIPVIVLTVMREEIERHAPLARSEIDVYMSKPFDTVRLRQTIERLLGGVQIWAPPKSGVAQAFDPTDDVTKT